MKDCRIYIFSAVFICLTAVKLCFPAVPTLLGQAVSKAICCQAEYGEAIQAVGRSFGRGQLVQALNDLRTHSSEGLISVLGQEKALEAVPSPVNGLTQP